VWVIEIRVIIKIKFNIMVIHNHLFEIVRKERQEIEKAIALLTKNGYVVSSKAKTYVQVPEENVNASN